VSQLSRQNDFDLTVVCQSCHGEEEEEEEGEEGEGGPSPAVRLLDILLPFLRKKSRQCFKYCHTQGPRSEAQNVTRAVTMTTVRVQYFLRVV